MSRPPDAALDKPASAKGEGASWQMLKSAVLIGGASALTIVIGIVRTKLIAILLGPAGFGLLSLYGAIVDLAVAVAGMGVNNSGVRQIAEANSSGDGQRLAQSAAVLKRIAVVLGILGACLVTVFCRQIAYFTFGSERHAGAVTLLSLAVLFQLTAGGLAALVQGMRRIAELASMSVLGALLGALCSIALVYAFGEDGVAPALVSTAVMLAAVSWWYSRKIEIQRVALTRGIMASETAALLKLGLAFMGSGILMLGAAYAVRLILTRNLGLDAAGLYAAAWTLGGLYVGFVLQAMGADFYPRLVGVATDHETAVRLVNEQAQVSMVIAGPGVIATLLFSPLVLSVFYSSAFLDAVGPLRWICLGIALRVVSWPMGYVIVAKSRQLLFFSVDLVWSCVNVGLTLALVHSLGVNAGGLAFFAAYAVHAVVVYLSIRFLVGFAWSAETRTTLLVFTMSIGSVFIALSWLPAWLAMTYGLLVMAATSAWSIHAIATMVPLAALHPRVQRLVIWSGLKKGDDVGAS